MSETTATIEAPQLLLDHHLKTLRLPTMLREYDRVARQCAAEDFDSPRYRLRMAELELLDRERRATEGRIRQAKFTVTLRSLKNNFSAHTYLLLVYNVNQFTGTKSSYSFQRQLELCNRAVWMRLDGNRRQTASLVMARCRAPSDAR